MNKIKSLKSLIARNPDIDWSIELHDVSTGTTAFSLDATRALKTASLAKVLLLVEVAARLSEGTLAADEPIDRRDIPRVQDSGLWRYLKTDILPLADAATLVAAVSDNWATNALLHHVGLGAVQARSNALGYPETLLADHIRDNRGPAHPPTVSKGRASDWADLFGRMHRRTLVSKEVDAQVEYWLGTGTDHSMVASALNLDPLIHGFADGALGICHKTGSDSGVRADAGLILGRNACSYCIVANWNPDDDRVDAVTEIMHAAGDVIRAMVTGKNAGA